MAIQYKPRTFTVDEFYRLADLGFIGEDERVELLDGLLYEMSPLGFVHGAVQAAVVTYLSRALGSRAVVTCPVTLPLGECNALEPDVVVTTPAPSFDPQGRLRRNDVLALVEVSSSSKQRDTVTKRDIYARFDIADYLVADVDDSLLLHFSHPHNGAYEAQRLMRRGESFTIAAFPDEPLASDPFFPLT